VWSPRMAPPSSGEFWPQWGGELTAGRGSWSSRNLAPPLGRLARDPDLDVSLTRFVGHPVYDLRQLRADLDRFTLLLGANDGEPLFGPSDPQ